MLGHVGGDVLQVHERFRHTQFEADFGEPLVLAVVSVVRLPIFQQLCVALDHVAVPEVVDVNE